jgi:hypothetical protein
MSEHSILAVVFVVVLIPTIMCAYCYVRMAWRGGYEIASTQHPSRGAATLLTPQPTAVTDVTADRSNTNVRT